ncbi:MAG: hypothetical protein K6B74_03330, partial [Ruminococcus sp.]|nr:hypothetical protein [Ruminococcus sp.]
SEGLFVGGVNRFAALDDEIMGGTGFVNGKFTVQDFYQKNSPTNREFANFLKKHYGIGGHSGEGDIRFVNHASNGIEFDLRSGERFRFTWADVADYTKHCRPHGTNVLIITVFRGRVQKRSR